MVSTTQAISKTDTRDVTCWTNKRPIVVGKGIAPETDLSVARNKAVSFPPSAIVVLLMMLFLSGVLMDKA